MWVKGKFPAEYAVNNTIFDGPLLINMVYIYIYIYFFFNPRDREKGHDWSKTHRTDQ